MATHPAIAKRLAAYAASFPDAWEDHPWGETVYKVGKKIFVFLSTSDALHVTVKLPDSADQALAFPWAEPTGYGLGPSGWVSVSYRERAKPPVDLFEDWIDESYRAVAPKKLIARLEAERSGKPARSAR